MGFLKMDKLRTEHSEHTEQTRVYDLHGLEPALLCVSDWQALSQQQYGIAGRHGTK